MSGSRKMISHGYAVSTVGRIIVLVWNDTPSVEGVVALKDAFVTADARSKVDALGLLTLIEAKAGGGMPPPVRDHLAQVIKENERAIKATAVVYEGTGFRATIVRSVLTAINMLNRPDYWFAVFQNRTLATEQLLAQMGRSEVPTRDELLEALASLTRHEQPAAVAQV